MHFRRHNFFLFGLWVEGFLSSILHCVPIVFQLSSPSFHCVPSNVANSTTFLSCMFCPKVNFHTHTYINIKCKRGPKGSTHGNICVSLVCVVFQVRKTCGKTTQTTSSIVVKTRCCCLGSQEDEVLLKQKLEKKTWSWNV